MQKKSEDFSVEEAMRLAKTPAGQQLLAMLRQENSGQLSQIMSMAQTGDMAGASHALKRILSSKDAQALLKKMEEQSHG